MFSGFLVDIKLSQVLPSSIVNGFQPIHHNPSHEIQDALPPCPRNLQPLAWGESCTDSGSGCCGGATCVPNGFGGGFCMMDDSCIAGGYPCLDTSYKSLGSCCHGAFCLPMPGLSSGGGFCVSSLSAESVMPAGK